MKPICFIDMDGVLCDFVSAACKLFGQPEAADNWPAGEYSMGKVLGCSDNEFWRTVESQPDFWESMPPYPWHRELFALVERHGYRPFIATSPSLDPRSASGKTAWIQKHIGRNFRDYFIGGKKDVLSLFDRVLIDDNDDQCAKFGRCGTALLFPRPWNANHANSQDPIGWVAERLKRLDTGGTE